MSAGPPGEGWEKNPGHQPEHTIGKRVAVIFRNGQAARVDPVGTTTSPGWAADKSRWTRRGPGVRDFDIEWFRVL